MPPLIFGPAYLDRVVHVDRPIVDPARRESPLDGSVDGQWVARGGWLAVVDPLGNRLDLATAGTAGWADVWGTVEISRPLAKPPGGWTRSLRVKMRLDDLGGMGAGYAAALGGELVSALGSDLGPISERIADLLLRHGITHHPVLVDGHPADWTLLITSGEHGDKLPIGFRGCHSAIEDLEPWASRPAELRVVAALPNRLARQALAGPSTIRMFAPSLRNILDRDPPISSFVGSIDILTCNKGEWKQLVDREQVAWQLSILIVTDGPNGATLRFTTPEGESSQLQVPAFPRSKPPGDTNRAGEAFGAEFVRVLIEDGWTPGTTSPDLARKALERASAASALVLDRLEFGFPTKAEVDTAIRLGRV